MKTTRTYDDLLNGVKWAEMQISAMDNDEKIGDDTTYSLAWNAGYKFGVKHALIMLRSIQELREDK